MAYCLISAVRTKNCELVSTNKHKTTGLFVILSSGFRRKTRGSIQPTSDLAETSTYFACMRYTTVLEIVTSTLKKIESGLSPFDFVTVGVIIK